MWRCVSTMGKLGMAKKILRLFRAGDLGVLAESLGAEAVVAAVDGEIGARDERGVVAEQKEGGAGDFDGVAHAAEHVKLAPNRIVFRAVAAGGFVDFARPDPAGADAVHADLVRREIERGAAGEL